MSLSGAKLQPCNDTLQLTLLHVQAAPGVIKLYRDLYRQTQMLPRHAPGYPGVQV